MEDALKRLARDHRDRPAERPQQNGAAAGKHSGHGIRQVNDLYEVALRDTAEGVRLFWQIKEDRKVWRGLREGAYLLRTNLQADTAEELWSKYMQLTEAEASFRALKSELSIRPLFHQNGAARQGPRDGGVPRLRAVGHAETSAEAPARDRPAAIRRAESTMHSRCRR